MKTNAASLLALAEQAAALLHDARYVVALTGAGISTPSGIPDFRSPSTGLWRQVDAFTTASLGGFRRRPEAFYEWLRPLAHKIREADPNPAHLALAELERRGIVREVITQNIDLLHTRAGSRVVHEVHGSIRQAVCLECHTTYPADGFIEAFVEGGTIPRCPADGAILKPDVVLFGEMLPLDTYQAALEAARRCDVMLVAGSSLTVSPASEYPLEAVRGGARLIVVNQEETYADRLASVVIHDDVATVLPRLVALVERPSEQ
jgi:NAD-dependent deacetylase